MSVEELIILLSVAGASIHLGRLWGSRDERWKWPGRIATMGITLVCGGVVARVHLFQMPFTHDDASWSLYFLLALIAILCGRIVFGEREILDE